MNKGIKNKHIIIIILIIIAIIGIIFGVRYTIKTINYHKTYEYKLKKIGYNIEEINSIQKLSNSNIEYVLTLDYNKNISMFINEKYFLEKNLKKYINYNNTNSYSLTDIVAIINVGSDNKWYSTINKTDITKNELMLTNKFNYLDDTYTSDNMVSVSNIYSYGENQMLTEDAYSAFIKMFKAAKEENLTIIINSSYRSFEDQKEIYDYYFRHNGEEYADNIAAHAGFSEHQTGLAVDVQTYGSSADTFENFEEFTWLQNNAYKYGFILRYPKDKEYITGYTYESWHYRYVGIEVATYIHENNITFDEYYAYFLE